MQAASELSERLGGNHWLNFCTNIPSLVYKGGLNELLGVSI